VIVSHAQRYKVALVLLLLIATYPLETTVVPAWRIRVVDEQARPYARLKVMQAWKHYTLELGDSENMEDRWTDNSGYVEFPARTIKVTIIGRALRIFTTFVSVVLHGSVGIHADLAAVGPNGYKSVEYVPGKSPPGQLVLPRNEKQ